MRQKISSFFELFLSKDTVRIVMSGLDSVGKTSILYKLKLGKAIYDIPKISFNIGIFNYRDIQFAVWDVSCQDNIRSLWPHYSKNTKGLIFVIDSSDYRRIYEARAELKRMLSKTELKDVVLLIYANKDDLHNAMTVWELSDKLKLQSFKNTKWHIQSCCAITGYGLTEGLEWLSNQLKN